MNFVKWKVETDKSCPRCKGEHDILHLLYFCPFSRNIWNTIDTILIVKDMFLYNNLSVTFAISVVRYLLYKGWFVKDTRKLQTGRELLGFIKSEIKYKLTVLRT